MSAKLLVCLALILPIGVVRFANAEANANELYEGDPCKMEDGKNGECVRISECPVRVQQVRIGLRSSNSPGRCSFDGFVEIVCCPKKENVQISVAPSSIISQFSTIIPANFVENSTEKLDPATETSTLINRLPESIVTLNTTSTTFNVPITYASSITEGAASFLPEETTEIINPLMEKATTIISLITETSSPLIDLMNSSTDKKITEVEVTTDTTNISDDRIGDLPNGIDAAMNQIAEMTTITASPTVEEMTIGPLMELLTSTLINRTTETVTKNMTETTDGENDGVRLAAEIVINQTTEAEEEKNIPWNGKTTTDESSMYDTISPTLEIITPTHASKIVETAVYNTTTQATTVNDNENGVRPAEVACNVYKKAFLDKDGKNIFSTPILNYETILRLGEFPFIAALGYKKNKDNSKLIDYRCGGTLITTQHILTAAHCVSNADNNVPVEVRLGSMNSNGISNSIQIIPIEEITIHPSYKFGLNYHDIAVIKLSTTVIKSQQVMPICIQYTNIPNLTMKINMSRVTAGWGMTSEDYNDLPQDSGLRLVEETTCNEFYKNYTSLVEGLNENMICLQDENISRRTVPCQVNNGGIPLVRVNKDSVNVIGVELLSQNCGSNKPGVYVNTFKYLDWIEKVVWPDLNQPTTISLLNTDYPEIDARMNPDKLILL